MLYSCLCHYEIKMYLLFLHIRKKHLSNVWVLFMKDFVTAIKPQNVLSAYWYFKIEFSSELGGHFVAWQTSHDMLMLCWADTAQIKPKSKSTVFLTVGYSCQWAQQEHNLLNKSLNKLEIWVLFQRFGTTNHFVI